MTLKTGREMVGILKFLERLRANAIVIVILISILFNSTVVVADEFDTTVYIDPSNQTVSPEENFTVNISCVPDQPIKSFEFRLSFNSSLLIANSVTEGNIFDGYDTFFNEGTINNSAGTIVDIYGLIIGTGNVTDSGTFVTINFTAKETAGVSLLVLSNVGVTNETSYVSVSVSNGSVQVDTISPVFDDASPSTGYTGNSYTFNVSVTDNTCAADELMVMVDWREL